MSVLHQGLQYTSPTFQATRRDLNHRDGKQRTRNHVGQLSRRVLRGSQEQRCRVRRATARNPKILREACFYLTVRKQRSSFAKQSSCQPSCETARFIDYNVEDAGKIDDRIGALRRLKKKKLQGTSPHKYRRCRCDSRLLETSQPKTSPFAI